MPKRGPVESVAAPSALRRLREEADLSREKLARAVAAVTSADTSMQTIYRIEEFGAVPSTTLSLALARTLSHLLGRKILVEDLFAGAVEDDRPDQLLNAIREGQLRARGRKRTSSDGYRPSRLDLGIRGRRRADLMPIATLDAERDIA